MLTDFLSEDHEFVLIDRAWTYDARQEAEKLRGAPPVFQWDLGTADAWILAFPIIRRSADFLEPVW